MFFRVLTRTLFFWSRNPRFEVLGELGSCDETKGGKAPHDSHDLTSFKGHFKSARVCTGAFPDAGRGSMSRGPSSSPTSSPSSSSSPISRRGGAGGSRGKGIQEGVQEGVVQSGGSLGESKGTASADP